MYLIWRTPSKTCVYLFSFIFFFHIVDKLRVFIVRHLSASVTSYLVANFDSPTIRKINTRKIGEAEYFIFIVLKSRGALLSPMYANCVCAHSNRVRRERDVNIIIFDTYSLNGSRFGCKKSFLWMYTLPKVNQAPSFRFIQLVCEALALIKGNLWQSINLNFTYHIHVKMKIWKNNV